MCGQSYLSVCGIEKERTNLLLHAHVLNEFIIIIIRGIRQNDEDFTPPLQLLGEDYMIIGFPYGHQFPGHQGSVEGGQGQEGQLQTDLMNQEIALVSSPGASSFDDSTIRHIQIQVWSFS